MTQEALNRIAEKLRRAGASLPAPELTGTIEGSIVTGLCIALALVESEIEALAQPEQEPVAWLLTDKKINSLQVDDIHRLIDRLKHAHHTDLCVRINGQDEWFEADWLKHMVRASPPQRTEQEPVCPDCKAKVLYECVACSSNNYPPQLEQEPVADDIASILTCRDMLDAQPVPEVDRVIWPEHTESEPVAWIERDMECDDFDPDSVTCVKPTIATDGWEWVGLYTTPPQRKPLTFAGQSISEIRLANGLTARFVKDILIVEFD